MKSLSQSPFNWPNFGIGLWVLPLILSGAPSVWGAACCGGGASAPAMILGDDEMQLTTALSTTEVIIDSVDGNGYWYTGSQHQVVQTIKLEAARLLNDRWQVGASLPLIKRQRGNESSTGLSDLGLTTAYEYLPDWDYNPYRPKGLIAFQLGIPLAKTKLESDTGGLDSRGLGFLTVGATVVHSKVIGRMDVANLIEIHHGFNKNAQVNNQDLTITPGWGGSLTFSGGYSLKDWRFGGGISWNYEDPIKTSGSTSAAVERYATGSLGITYLPSDHWTANLTYSNQTWFGSPVNTSLGSTLLVSVQHHWLR